MRQHCISQRHKKCALASGKCQTCPFQVSAACSANYSCPVTMLMGSRLSHDSHLQDPINNMTLICRIPSTVCTITGEHFTFQILAVCSANYSCPVTMLMGSRLSHDSHLQDPINSLHDYWWKLHIPGISCLFRPLSWSCYNSNG
ncbi:hypothetical protein J6590_061035 [Homalodisca vitripennis]|nr:hypothetical protein J6590_061035 [Homalodisca vitripennis]